MRKFNIGATVLTAVVTSLVTSGTWLSLTPAEASSRTAYTVFQGPKVTVAPGDVGHSVLNCPGAGAHAIAGGYIITGFVGVSVPSAEEDAFGSTDADWYVTVANPKASSGDVAFRAEVTCIQ